MIRVQPVRLPGEFLRSRGINPANTFDWAHHGVREGQEGDRYILSQLHYVPYRYDPAAKGDESTSGAVLTRYAPDGAPAAQAFIPGDRDRSTLTSLSVLPDGRVLVSGIDDRAYALDPDLTSLDEITFAWSDRWAHRTRRTPSGRTLFLFGRSVVALAEDPPGDVPPALTAVTALRPRPAPSPGRPRSSPRWPGRPPTSSS